jgi:hypothetical protein
MMGHFFASFAVPFAHFAVMGLRALGNVKMLNRKGRKENLNWDAQLMMKVLDTGAARVIMRNSP